MKNAILAFKPVSHAPDGLDILRIGRIGLNFFADFANVDGQRGQVAQGIPAPDPFE